MEQGKASGTSINKTTHTKNNCKQRISGMDIGERMWQRGWEDNNTIADIRGAATGAD
jgi:hypothetical protein